MVTVKKEKKKKSQRHYLPDNGSLAIKAAVPADKLIPRLSGYKDIVQLIYKVLFQGLSVLVYKRKKTQRWLQTEKKTLLMSVWDFCYSQEQQLMNVSLKTAILPENSPELSTGPGYRLRSPTLYMSQLSKPTYFFHCLNHRLSIRYLKNKIFGDVNDKYMKLDEFDDRL